MCINGRSYNEENFDTPTDFIFEKDCYVPLEEGPKIFKFDENMFAVTMIG